MKKIINGLRYNSENATLIGEADNLCKGVDSGTDFAYWEAALYRTPTSGRYFLVGHGGPQSRFAQSVGQNTWGGGSDLIPLDAEEARDWAEVNLTTDEVEAAFGELVEDA